MASFEELTRFHSDEYVNFLKKITPFNSQQFTTQMNKCKKNTHCIVYIGNQTDCPIFPGMYEFCQKYSGASLGKLNIQNK